MPFLQYDLYENFKSSQNLLVICGLLPQKAGCLRKPDVFDVHINYLQPHAVIHCPLHGLFCQQHCVRPTKPSSEKKSHGYLVHHHPNPNLQRKVISHQTNLISMAGIEVNVWLELSLIIKQGHEQCTSYSSSPSEGTVQTLCVS